jgi:hypothetical protein
MIEHFDAVAILYDSRLFVDLGDAIAEEGLDSGDVSDFEDASAIAMAGGKYLRDGQAERECAELRPSRSGRPRAGLRFRERFHWGIFTIARRDGR